MLKECNKGKELKRELLTNSDKMELLGCIIDIFEDFLEEHNITIENDEREDDECAAIIYGTDYDWLSNGIERVLVNANVLNPTCAVARKECVGCLKECRDRIIY